MEGWSGNKDDLFTCRTSFVSVMNTLVMLTKYKYGDIEFIEILSRGKVI